MRTKPLASFSSLCMSQVPLRQTVCKNYGFEAVFTAFAPCVNGFLVERIKNLADVKSGPTVEIMIRLTPCST